MLTLLLKFLLAHLIGDFLLQPNKWVQEKEQKKQYSIYLYLHVLIHALTLIILLGFDFSYWLGIVLVVGSHYMIDLIKLKLNTTVNQRFLFFADQLLHAAVFIGVVHFYEPFFIPFHFISSSVSLLLMTHVLLITVTASVVLKVLLSKWKLNTDDEEGSLQLAGTYIGMLERLFIFGFVVLGYWQGVGFLLAAKSVFRFSDLSRSKDRKLTEYILIGTLLSFGIAMLLGLSYHYCLELIKE